MKVRIWYDKGYFYPQYKGKFFWRYYLYLGNIVGFKTQEEAFKALTNPMYNNRAKTVYEGEI